MRIRWTPGAAADLEQIHDDLAQNYPHLAHSTVLRIHEAIRSLTTFPNRGRMGREEGTREILLNRLPISWFTV
jgi:toxin ParE1/3/4